MDKVFFETKDELITYQKARALSPLPHLHKEVELVYVKEGGARAFADKNIVSLKDGDIFIAFPNQIHYYEDSLEGNYRVIIFSPDIIFELKDTLVEKYPRHRTSSPEKNKHIISLIEKMDECQSKYAQTVRVGLLNQIMGLLLEDFKLIPRTKIENYPIADFFSYCEKNFTENISLDTASEALHISKSHISHLLNQKFGIGFSFYLKSLRIAAACDLLTQTDKKLADISEEVGFGSIRSFNRAFMEIMYTTPLKYRNSNPEHFKKFDAFRKNQL